MYQSYIQALVHSMIFLFERYDATLVHLDKLEAAMALDNNQKYKPCFQAECKKIIIENKDMRHGGGFESSNYNEEPTGEEVELQRSVRLNRQGGN